MSRLTTTPTRTRGSLATVPRRAARSVAGLLTGALVLSGCSVYDAPLPGGADTGDDPIKVTVMFRDVLDLVPQSNVKVNDVTVGKITAIDLKGYIAEVSLELPADVELPDNATAQIRQTSLLGEKFVSLAAPQTPSSGELGDGDTIGLERTGRNPEVEEVFGALALLLNGGGVGQMKTIASELNTAFEGREDEVKSVLTQIRTFMGQLDSNKAAIVAALENTNRLAVQLRNQEGTLNSALDRIPDTLRSVNRQRADLVKMMQALERLSGVGVRVIQASKESTINSFRSLAPVLEEFAAAGRAMPDSLQVFLTYPFVDAAIGNDPQVARNLHMGDYTNLSVDLDIDLQDLPPLPGEVCDVTTAIRDEAERRANEAADELIEPLPGPVRDSDVDGNGKTLEEEFRDSLVTRALGQINRQTCRPPSVGDLLDFGEAELRELLAALPDNLTDLIPGGVLGDLAGGGSGGTDGGIGVPGLPRADLNDSYRTPEPIDPFDLARHGLDPGIGTMLLQGVADVR